MLIIILALLGITAIFRVTTSTLIQRNLLALQMARGLLAGGPLPDAGQFSPLAGDCRASWLLGWLENREAPQPMLNDHWRQAIECNPQKVDLLRAYYPTDLALARQVNAVQPNSAQGWFWLAELSAAAQPNDLIEYYRRGLAIDPTDSYRWRLLAELLVKADDLPAALEAYRMACYTGDAGAHGCLGAGGVAEKLGDYQAAMRYYRMSRWPKIWERAERLEKQLQQKP